MGLGQLSKVFEHLRAAVERSDTAGMSDADLLKRFAQQRDHEAFEILVRRHGPMVMGVCRRVLRNSHDAEDVFQATFLVLVRKAATLRSPGMVGNWLYGVAYRTALHARDAAAKRRMKETAMVPQRAAAEDTWGDLRLALDQELERLPDKYRAVILLCDLEGKTRKEAARQLGWAEGTVASRLVRGRALLAKRLARHGLQLSGGALAATLAQNAPACVSSSVVSTTIKAASVLAAGTTAGSGAISVTVVALTEGVLKAMMMSKLKAVVSVVLVLGFVAAGVTALTHRMVAALGVKLPTTEIKPDARMSKLVSGKLEPEIKASQDEKSIFEGSKAGDRKELAPGIAFRWCPAGCFKMGEGDDAVAVELSKGFWLGETEVTQGQWQKLMGTRPWIRGRVQGLDGLQRDIKEGPDYAASYISHDDALSFCKKLTTQEEGARRLPKTWKYALPTEAQWESACRAGTKTRFSFGDDESQLRQYAWFRENPDKVEECAHQVGLKKPNAWGLRDMHGNVWEWCSDLYGDRLPGGKDPVGPSSGKNRVIRGCSWIDPAASCPSANRFYYNPRLRNGVQGFRIAAVSSAATGKKAKQAENPKEDLLPRGPYTEIPANDFPVGWGGGGGKDYEIRVDKTVRHGGKTSGSIRSVTTIPQWYGALTQAFNADKYRGQRLRMTAYVKTKHVENSAGLWMIIEGFDGKGNFSVSKDLMRTPLKGTNDWKQCEVVLDVPKEGAAQISFGAMLAGKGQMWVDDFKFETVGNAIKTTGRVETGKDTGKDAVASVKCLTTEPKYLDFEQLTPEAQFKPDPPAANEKK